MKPIVRLAMGVVITSFMLAGVSAQAGGECESLPTAAQLRTMLGNAASGTGISATLGPGTTPGGLFGGKLMWAAVVNREGELCSFVTSTPDPSLVWPGSQAIAKAKAFTANAFSNDTLPLSTARLYTFVQPGHSLFGLNNSNPFNPRFLNETEATEGGNGRVAGGIITFGGGVPLYNLGGHIVGGLGVSGDTACTDHEIAKRVRDLAGLNPTGGPLADDISYSKPDGASVFTHPLCVNTVRNGVTIGTELPAVGY